MRGDAVVAYPLFHKGEGGSTPTSPLQFEIGVTSWQRAIDLNKKWHSRLPLYRVGYQPLQHCKVCYAALFDGLIYAVAIWSPPCARLLPQKEWLELRRMAICNDAPKNTASRMLKIMTILIRSKYPEITTLISYQDVEVHKGTIYKAAGWAPSHYTKGAEWNSKTRNRPPVQVKADKIRWQKEIR